jgi:hypothetical protein
LTVSKCFQLFCALNIFPAASMRRHYIFSTKLFFYLTLRRDIQQRSGTLQNGMGDMWNNAIQDGTSLTKRWRFQGPSSQSCLSPWGSHKVVKADRKEFGKFANFQMKNNNHLDTCVRWLRTKLNGMYITSFFVSIYPACSSIWNLRFKIRGCEKIFLLFRVFFSSMWRNCHFR